MVTRHFSRSLVSHAELDELDVARAELFAYYATARRLKTAADQAVRIASVGETLSEPPANETAADVRAAADDVAGAVDDAVTAVLSGDAAEARRARVECDDAADGVEAIKRRVYDGSVSTSVPAAVALSDVLSHLQRAAECGRGVADVAARTAIRAANTDG
jgi:phosphate uptake regulator